jgi:hypothetical protein
LRRRAFAESPAMSDEIRSTLLSEAKLNEVKSRFLGVPARRDTLYANLTYKQTECLYLAPAPVLFKFFLIPVPYCCHRGQIKAPLKTELPVLFLLLTKMEHTRILIKQVLKFADQQGLLLKYRDLDCVEFNTALALWNELAEIQDVRMKLNHILTIASYTEALNIMTAILAEWPVD